MERRELFPRCSPDGKTIAFIGNYEGNFDLYTLPTVGGVPFRVTYHPGFEQLTDWTPDGRLIFSSNMSSGIARAPKLFTVAATGGMPEALPVPYGSAGTLSDDGKRLLYTPRNRDSRTWKRYKGGLASDLWTYNLRTGASKRLTEWDGTDTQPMWHGNDVYYLSDAGPNHRLNIWKYEAAGGNHRQVTKFEDDDVRWPAIGPGPDGRGEIVFQNGADLYLLDLATEAAKVVKVQIPGDRPTLAPRLVDVSGSISGWSISPKGKRVAVAARGDIWTLPAKDGFPRNLTRTAGTAEKDPAWSPDGRWIAYLSDATGEYELYITQSDGKGETKQLTRGGKVIKVNPSWSPDSRKIVFGDKTGYVLMLHDLDTGKTTEIDRDPLGGDFNVGWAPDSRFFAYARSTGNFTTNALFIYSFLDGKSRQVTADMFGEGRPVFGPEGKYLFFPTARSFRPTYSDVDSTFVYVGSNVLAVAPLKADIDSPFAPKNDEAEFKEDAGEDGDGKTDKAKEKKGKKSDKDKGNHGGENAENGGGKDKKKKEVKVEIDFEGLASRVVQVPVPAGRLNNISVTKKGHLLYVRTPVGPGAKPSILLLDPKDEKHEEKTLVKGAGAYELAADGETMLYLQKRKGFIRKAAPNGKPKPVPTSGMTAEIDPREEWAEVLREAYRYERDYFYDPNMHGVDWENVYKHYASMLKDCTTRNDVGFLVREMISELNIGHAYYRSAPEENQGPRRPVGMLGADFELDHGRFRFAKIYGGAQWDLDARGPLGRPGVDVKEGDYLLQVNGVEPDPSKAVWAAFLGKAGSTVELTVSAKPELDDDARTVLVKTAGSERGLRYRNWIEMNRRYVEEKSGGKVGYIHVPDTGVNGQNELFRQYFGQVKKEALIIDERWNGGGQLPNRFIELLNRPIIHYFSIAGDFEFPVPFDGHQGPKCMLINGWAGSGGDAFPSYFRQAGLGPLIGRRTWGGLVGIMGARPMVDGSGVTVPQFAYYEKNGTWGIEGYGVAPDLEVMDDPAEMRDGNDPQLNAAIDEMLKEIKTDGYHPPKRPAYPDRSGMGITEADK